MEGILYYGKIGYFRDFFVSRPGAQYPLMAMDLLEAHASVQRLFKTASQAADQDLEALLRNSDADTLKRTDVSQPTITIANLAAATVLQERGVSPMACAGFSLGEYAALAIAGVLSVEDCDVPGDPTGSGYAEGRRPYRRTGNRYRRVQRTGNGGVLGLSPDQVESLIAQWSSEGLKDLYGANFNSPKQVVVAGTSASLAEAENVLRKPEGEGFCGSRWRVPSIRPSSRKRRKNSVLCWRRSPLRTPSSPSSLM